MSETLSEQESRERVERLMKASNERLIKQYQLWAEQDEFYAEEFRRRVKMTRLWRKLWPLAVVAAIIGLGLWSFLIFAAMTLILRRVT